jgi:isochorismate synthase
MSQAIVDADEAYPFPAPICLGGFAFDDGRARGPEWNAFPDGLLVVPRVLVTRSGSASWVTVNATTSGGVDTAADVDETVSLLSMLLTPAGGRLTGMHSGGGRPGCEAQESLTPDRTAPREGSGSRQWKAAVAAIVDDIHRGIVEKQVLACCVRTLGREAAEPARVLERLRGAFGASCTIFAVARDDACFLGASPERLVRIEGHTVRADALAGSAARGSALDEDHALGAALLADPKELQEHALVVRALREALAPDCVALTVPAEPTLVHMPNVQHLHTPVEGVLRRDAHILELVERLHPTPAVGGVPRVAILERIRSYEEFDRGWYAGPVGWVDARGGGDFAIAIRSALMTSLAAGPSGVRLYAGCGIVGGSDPEAEYQELRLKLRPLAWGTEAIELLGAVGDARPSDGLALG